jgi:hypothetical protein
MQSPFVKPLDRSFVDFFAKIGMQNPFAKLLELLLERGTDQICTSILQILYTRMHYYITRHREYVQPI